MRTMQMLAAALMTVLAAMPPVEAQNPGPTNGSGWVTQLAIQRIEDGFLERPGTARLAPQREGGWSTFTRTNEMPADLAARPFTHESFVVVDVSSAGHATACRPLRTSAEPRLDALACRLLMRPEYFNAYLIPVDPSPAPAQWAIGLRFETMDAAEAAERQANMRNVLTSLGFPPPNRVTRAGAGPPPIRVAPASGAGAPAICSLRPGWTAYSADGLESRYEGRANNRINVAGNGSARWNDAPISRDDLRRYLEVTRAMRPRPLLILNRQSDATCQDIVPWAEIIEANYDCRNDNCLLASGVAALEPGPPPPPPRREPSTRR